MHFLLLTISKYIHSLLLCQERIQCDFSMFNCRGGGYTFYRSLGFELIQNKEQYQCDRAPCNNVVACYVDRPKQKTLVIYIMFATGCITVLVGLIEFFSLGMGKIYEAWANRHDGKLFHIPRRIKGVGSRVRGESGRSWGK